MLIQNLEGPENERLDVQEFCLDLVDQAKKKDNARKDCLLMKEYYGKLIVAQDKVTTWIRKTFWDSMHVQGRIIQGIFANFEVENYTLLPPDGRQQEVLKIVEQFRSIENELAVDDIFEPWNPQEERYE